MPPQETYTLSIAALLCTLMAYFALPVSWATVTPGTVVVETPLTTLLSGFHGAGVSFEQVPA